MKTAFAYWHKRIAPVFDTAVRIHVIDVDNEKIVRESQETLAGDMIVQKALRLSELGVSTLVCGAISKPVHDMIISSGIRVIPFVAGDLEEVVQACRNGNLEQEAYSMPGCRRNPPFRGRGNGKAAAKKRRRQCRGGMNRTQ
jgi:predicted Fe-Mo cluster-binding NifX family protein